MRGIPGSGRGACPLLGAARTSLLYVRVMWRDEQLLLMLVSLTTVHYNSRHNTNVEPCRPVAVDKAIPGIRRLSDREPGFSDPRQAHPGFLNLVPKHGGGELHGGARRCLFGRIITRVEQIDVQSVHFRYQHTE